MESPQSSLFMPYDSSMNLAKSLPNTAQGPILGTLHSVLKFKKLLDDAQTPVVRFRNHRVGNAAVKGDESPAVMNCKRQ